MYTYPAVEIYVKLDVLRPFFDVGFGWVYYCITNFQHIPKECKGWKEILIIEQDTVEEVIEMYVKKNDDLKRTIRKEMGNAPLAPQSMFNQKFSANKAFALMITVRRAGPSETVMPGGRSKGFRDKGHERVALKVRPNCFARDGHMCLPVFNSFSRSRIAAKTIN
ncbi:hypothetical protein BDK51DRAFT_29967 [Blyttiomyces helicus]|uniref:Uncharacterized protein n=1 Tax=Blyttiomyces helicus TaxID=388810 RepID=A0A4P9WN89_9FUNG|nr:hypothetical protein BDK51DRAFT_29967 [Blyttiomyces helicus]|eukprot:RKO93725.1 hypothetical protein BDK51DRAFT_29967 [Blyttiomyces helicus]